MAKDFGVDSAVFQKSIVALIEGGYFSPTGARADELLDAMVELMRSAGTFEGKVEWDEVFDSRFVPTASN